MSKKNNNEENPKKGKSVYFNTEIPYENELYEYSKKVKNFSNYVKTLMYRDMVSNNYAVPNPYDLDFRSRMEEAPPVVQSKKVATPVKSSNSLQPKDEATRKELESFEQELNSQQPTDDDQSPKEEVQPQQISQYEEDESVEKEDTDNKPKTVVTRGDGGLAAGARKKRTMW